MDTVARRSRPALLSWWLWTLAAVGVLLFAGGLLVQVGCTHGLCVVTPPVQARLSPDAIGGWPRLFTTGVFLVTTVFAVRGALAARERQRWWWWAIVAVGCGLAYAKVTSDHSALESDVGRLVTLVAALVCVVIGAIVLLTTGRAWDVPGSGVVVSALSCYAAAALGLDQLTGLAASSGRSTVLLAARWFEESGEAGTALVLLVVVRWAAGTLVRSLQS